MSDPVNHLSQDQLRPVELPEKALSENAKNLGKENVLAKSLADYSEEMMP